MQRNFVAKYLGNTQKDAALVAFYGDDPEDWRFSFVKMEYNLVKDESGKVKPVKELTPAKRYSFLVGVNEPNHTCRSQFLKLVMEEEVNVDDELDEVISLVVYDLTLDNITIEKNIEKSLQLISADRKQVQEIFFNIIRNAAQAIKGTGKIAVKMTNNNK